MSPGKLISKVFILIVSCILMLSFFSFNDEDEKNFNYAFRKYFIAHNNALVKDVLKMFDEAGKKDFNVDSVKTYLSDSRREYKSIEGFVIYFFPGDARKINRAIIAEMEEDDELGSYVVPHGFQYLEQLLYGDSAILNRKKIRNEINNIYALIGNFNEGVSKMDINKRDVFEAMQMQLIRQFMLGFANFETGDSRTGIPESSATISSIKEFIQIAFPDPKAKDRDSFYNLYKSIDLAVDYLKKVKPKDEPDYFTFYSKYYIPVSENLVHVREQSVENNFYNTIAVNYAVRSIFDPNAFNTNFFLPAKKVGSHAAVVELGRTLFFDPALSANNLRACASCHQADKAFTDGLALSQSFEPGRMLGRNAPTVVNSVFQRRLFHDGRVASFEDQAGQVMSNPLEMHNDFSQVAMKLRNSPEYIRWFRSAFSGTKDTSITSSSVLTAIAEYERSVIGLNSRFDKTISGREKLMNEDEKDGFNLYMGKANCASCHFIPLFNGTMPPEFVDTEWEIIGVPSSEKGKHPELDSDLGRAGVMDDAIFKHAFKPSTLRNIELTGPYMHNGVFRTLEEVIEFYNVGGGIGLGYDVPYQTLPEDSLHLTEAEKFKLVAFLKTLTDTSNITLKPASLPSFPNDPKLNDRPIGGNY